jgi:hypothetical protein
VSAAPEIRRSMWTLIGHALCSAALVGVPVVLLSQQFDRPVWVWLLLAGFGTVVVFRCVGHMWRVVEWDRRENPIYGPPTPPTSLFDDYQRAMLGFLKVTGLMPHFERFANWLARRFPSEDKP